MKVLPQCENGWVIQDKKTSLIQDVKGRHKTLSSAKKAARKQNLKGSVFNIFE